MYVCVSAREDAQEVCCALVYGLYLNGRQVGKVRSVLSIPVVFITMNILFQPIHPSYIKSRILFVEIQNVSKQALGVI